VLRAAGAGCRSDTWESWYFWNITSHLLRAGPAFCAAAPATRAALFASWRRGLDDVCHAHVHNNAYAFIVYWSAYEALCRRLQLNPERRAALGCVRGRPVSSAADEACPSSIGSIADLRGAWQALVSWATGKARPSTWQALVNETQAYWEAEYAYGIERLRRAGDCDLVKVIASDLIAAFGNDTELTLSMGKALVRHGLGGAGSYRESSPCTSLSEARKLELYEEIGKLPADERLGRRNGFMNLPR